MTKLDKQLLAYIAQHHPAIWDAVFPHGPAVGVRLSGEMLAGLSSQPIPPDPTERVGLNPQPLPPRALGELLAAELIRTAQTATSIGAKTSPYRFDDDWYCGTPPIIRINPKKGPVGPHEPGTPPVMLRDFHLGVASVLATVEGTLAKDPLITSALKAHGDALERSL